MEKKASKFEPVLMYQEMKKVTELEKKVAVHVNRLNAGLKETEILLGEPLTDKEKVMVLKNGFSWVMDKLRGQYQFPKADDDFNLKAMGKDTETAKKALYDFPGQYEAYDFEIKDGIVQLTKEAQAAIKQSGCYYTENEHQNKVFERMKIICRLFREMEDDDFHNGRYGGVGNIDHTIQFLMSGNWVEEHFKPDYRVIKRINEKGKFVPWL